MFSKIKKILTSYFQKYNKKDDAPTEQSATDIDVQEIIKLEENIPDFYSIFDEDIPFESVQESAIPVKNPFQNPLKPYWKPFVYEWDKPSTQINRFSKEGRPLTPEQYREVFYKHVCLSNFLGRKKRNYLHKIWKDAEYLKNVFEPLTKMGISYTLDLTGGSVRDFVLNKHESIKDLDFMLSIQLKHAVSTWDIEKNFTKEQIESVDFYSSHDPDFRKVKLIELCFLKHNETIKTYDYAVKRKIKIGEDRYKDIFKYDRLIGVFKTDGSKTNYPIDILLTDFSKPNFIADFDFDICKASICFINPYVQKDFPTSFTHLISRFVADIEFWADVYNKTITYDTSNRTTYQIDSSFDNHLNRIEQKYPDYKLLVVGDGENKAYLESKILDKTLSKKDDVIIKKKVKI